MTDILLFPPPELPIPENQKTQETVYQFYQFMIAQDKFNQAVKTVLEIQERQIKNLQGRKKWWKRLQ